MKKDPAVRAIIAEWRRLTTARGGARRGAGEAVLVACSGGADSSSLAIALSAAGGREPARVVLAHIVHDLRPRAEALADRDATRKLAGLLGLEFVEAEVHVRRGAARRANAEGAARAARYAALAELAKREGLGFIATAHHADDQLETVLMALMRGAGPRGLAGVAESRPLASGVRVIRPMLAAGVSRGDAERICRDFGWEWREDATNTDQSRLRAAVRLQVIPVIKSIRPRAASRACAMARLMHDVERLVRGGAARLWARRESEAATGSARWNRPALRRVSAAVLGELVRGSARQLDGPSARADRLGQSALGPVVRAIKDDSTEPRRFTIGGIEVDVTSRTVTIRKRRSR